MSDQKKNQSGQDLDSLLASLQPLTGAGFVPGDGDLEGGEAGGADPQGERTPGQAPGAAETAGSAGSAVGSFAEMPPVEESFEESVARTSKGRSPFMMFVMILFSFILGYMYLEDLQYYVQPEEPVVLPNTEKFHRERQVSRDALDGYGHNRFVRLAGLVSHPSRTDDGVMFFKLAYVPVLVRVVDDSNRFITDWVHYSVSGRLVDMDRSTRYNSLKGYYRQQLGHSLDGYYLLLGGEEPAKYWYVPLLYLVLGAIALVNMGLLVRRFIRNR